MMTPYKLVAASMLACACAGAGAKPASAPAGAATTQGAAAANTPAPDGADPADPDALPDISKFKHARDDDESRNAVPAQDLNVRRDGSASASPRTGWTAAHGRREWAVDGAPARAGR